MTKQNSIIQVVTVCSHAAKNNHLEENMNVVFEATKFEKNVLKKSQEMKFKLPQRHFLSFNDNKRFQVCS